MSIIVALYLLSIVFLLIATIVAIRTTIQARLRLVLLALFAAHLLCSPWLLIELLGRAKPLQWEWYRLGTQTELLTHYLQPETAIYILIRADGDPEPLLYRLPWSLVQASQLREAQERRAAKGERQNFKMKREFAEGEKVVHPEPQSALPPKFTER